MAIPVRGETVRLEAGPGKAYPTVVAARDAIRAARAAGKWENVDLVVSLAAGTSHLTEPLVFTPEDGGVTYLAESGPVEWSGGVKIDGWATGELNGKPAWVADLPDVASGAWNFRMLFVDGVPVTRSRFPKTGFANFAGIPGMAKDHPWNKGNNVAQFAAGALNPAWKNRSDIDVVALTLWVEARMNIADYDPATRIATFRAPSVWRLTDDWDGKDFARYYLEGVAELTTEPGEWYLDRPAGKLYYLPMPGQEMGKTVVVAPKLGSVLRVEGTPDNPVRGLHFSGITVTGAHFETPPDRTGTYQSAADVPAAVVFNHAEGCSFANGAIARCGTYGVEVMGSSSGVEIIGNAIEDLGGGGVKVNNGTRGTVIDRNRMERLGRVFQSACGVWIGKSSGNVVTRNLIADLYYSAVSVGWTWGYHEPSEARDNRVEDNHLHTIGQGLLSDMAAVYTLGVSPGTIIRGNRIHDVAGARYGGWGIYMDEGSSEILVENNVVFRTTHGGFHQHYGRDNVVRNNVFAFSQNGQIARGRDEEHRSFTFERNIVVWDEGKLLDGNWGKGSTELRNNVYWRLGGGPLDFAGMDFAAWQKLGRDQGSMIANPRFIAPKDGDFRLGEGSPADQIGFDPAGMPLDEPGRRLAQ